MIAVAFFTLVGMALVGIALNLVIRIRLMKRDTARDRLDWLSRGSAEAWDTYKALFPNSSMPRFLRIIFWAVVVFAFLTLIVGLLMPR